MFKISIGDLNKRITFQNYIEKTDESGFPIEEWTDFKTVWAGMTNLHGREYFAAAATQTEKTVKFTLRYCEGIDTYMHIVYEGKIYDITFIDNMKYSDEFMEIHTLQRR